MFQKSIFKLDKKAFVKEKMWFTAKMFFKTISQRHVDNYERNWKNSVCIVTKNF